MVAVSRSRAASSAGQLGSERAHQRGDEPDGHRHDEAVPIAEVAVDDRLGHAAGGRDLVHRHARAVPADQVDGGVEQLFAPLGLGLGFSVAPIGDRGGSHCYRR